MLEKVDLYDSAYGNYGADIYRDIRIETYGEDLGQTSWVTIGEANEIPQLLELTAGSTVLEIGCGSGRYALRLAGAAGCNVVGLDVNSYAVQTANELAHASELSSRVHFQQCDASRPLMFDTAGFDAVFANDVMCHVPGRLTVLREVCRVLKPGGRLLFSDALVIGGVVSHEEIARRSSIGYYLFSPPGENERFLSAAGFGVVAVNDTTGNVATIAQRWHDARQKREVDLTAIEGAANFTGVQTFLASVQTLCSEERLRRYVYLARKNS